MVEEANRRFAVAMGGIFRSLTPVRFPVPKRVSTYLGLDGAHLSRPSP
jgi:hypothetical protein